jgi:hypothetical protein
MKLIESLRRTCVLYAGAAALLALLGTADTARADDDRGLRIVGLTDDGHLVRFRSNTPRETRDVGAVTLTGGGGDDTALIGIDYRVQDGKLYGVGNGGGVYVIDPSTARGTFVNELTVTLDGTYFGVDFNPAADRLRIISDTGQNLAHNVNAGGTTTMNGTLTYTAPPATAVPALGVTAAAYTNNDLNQPSTATTLFDLDTTLDQVVIQSPPGNGVLAPTGKLGVDAQAWAGFDIFSRLRGGVTLSNHALAALTVNGSQILYLIELTTGQASRLGRLGDSVIDLAIQLAPNS